MTHEHRIFVGIVLPALMLAGCVGSGEQYPSLAIRDVERNPVQSEPAPPIEPVALTLRSLAPSRSVDDFVEQASALHRTFLAREPAARRLVAQARGTSTDSDIRARATIALADLSSIRSQTEIALADLDLLIAEGSNRFEDTALADAGHALVLDLVNEQDRTLSSLWRMLAR